MTDIAILDKICEKAIENINKQTDPIIADAIKEIRKEMIVLGIPTWEPTEEGGSRPSVESDFIISRVTDVITLNTAFTASFSYLVGFDGENQE
jgi:hypothetical protein